MLVKQAADVRLDEVQEGIGIRWVLTKRDGAPNFSLRIIEIASGVVFAPHQHPSEHEISVLEGQGVVTGPQGELEMQPGAVLFVAPDELHGYRNTGDVTLKFICVIPLPSVRKNKS